MGFRAVQLSGATVGADPWTTSFSRRFRETHMPPWRPLSDLPTIDPTVLRETRDELGLARSMHVSEDMMHSWRAFLCEPDRREYEAYENQLVHAVEYAHVVRADPVTFHPPYLDPPAWHTNKHRRLSDWLVYYHRLRDQGVLERVTDSFAEMVRGVLDRTRGTPVRLGVEAFMPPHGPFADLQALLDFLERFDDERLGVLLDTGEAHSLGGLDVSETARALGKRLFELHVRDAVRHRPEDSRTQDHFIQHLRESSRSVGKGEIDFVRLLATLRDMGYDGFLSLEIAQFGLTPAEIIGSRVVLESILAGNTQP